MASIAGVLAKKEGWPSPVARRAVVCRKRYRVEVFFHRLKRFRALATRYEKSARNYLALLHIACITLWLGP